jgi:hypothetical protein
MREQIRQMIEDNIIEISDSPFIDPLTIVYKVRLGVDARTINLLKPSGSYMYHAL